MSDGSAAEAPTFEVALARLETIVTRLERGEITLDESLAAFKEGSGLVRLCLTRLEAAEVAVQQLVEGAGGDVLKPIDPARLSPQRPMASGPAGPRAAEPRTDPRRAAPGGDYLDPDV